MSKTTTQKKSTPASTPQDFYNSDGTQLPPNFAQSVLNLEMKLDSEQICLEVVTELNQLYRIGVEHYITYDSKKAAYFQRKLSQLLTNPVTLQLIQPRQKAKFQPAKVLALNNNVKQQLNKFNTQAQTYVKNIIESSERKLEKSESLIRLSISNQQDSLQKRLMMRSQSRKNL